MKSWLKFFFGSFFSDKLSAEAAERNLWNSFLYAVLMIIILCTGYFAGFMSAFGYHCNNSSEYAEFISSAFDGITLSMNGGVLSASQRVNDFEQLEGEQKLEGYGLILDTAPAETNYAQFTVPCVDSKGKEISYEEYRELSDDAKKNYELKLQSSGKKLDVTLKQDEYKAFLNGSEDGKKTLAELDEKLAKGEITEKDYANKVYVEYVKAYYPPMNRVEQYGEAPTLRTYYLGMVASDFSDKYLMILDNMLVGSFVTDNNVTVDFEGYYFGIGDGEITDISAFTEAAFAGSGGYNFLIYLLNMFRLVPVILIVFLILAALVFIVARYKIPALGTGYIGSFKIVCSYSLIASLIAFAASVAASFFYAKGVVYLAVAVIFCLTVALRTAVFLIRGWLACRKADDGGDI